MPNTSFKQGEVKCASCLKKGKKLDMWKPPSSLRYCCPTVDCMAIMADMIKKKKQLAEAKKQRARTKQLKKENESRKDLYARFANLNQQYAKHIVYKGQPCYTCDKEQRPGDRGGAFHAGHFKPAKIYDCRRFMIENIRIQCFKCNKMLSGNQAEFRLRLEQEKGVEFVEWLEAEANHKPLIEIFPDKDDIREAISEMRKKIKSAGLSPRT